MRRPCAGFDLSSMFCAQLAAAVLVNNYFFHILILMFVVPILFSSFSSHTVSHPALQTTPQTSRPFFTRKTPLPSKSHHFCDCCTSQDEVSVAQPKPIYANTDGLQNCTLIPPDSMRAPRINLSDSNGPTSTMSDCSILIPKPFINT